MNNMISVMALLLTLTIPSLSFAAGVSDASVERLLTLSGLSKQVAELPGTVSAGFDQARQQGTAIPEAEFNEMKRLIASAFVAGEFLAAVSSELKSSLSEAEVKQLLAWYESAPGRIVTKAEEDASTAAAYQEMVKNAQTLLADGERMQIARKIDSLVGATDMALQLQKNAGVAVYMSIATALFPDERLDVEGLKARLATEEPQMRGSIEQLVLLSFVYCYRDVETASLDSYLAFLENPAARRFNASVKKGMNSAFAQAIDKVANSLAATFRKTKN